MQVKLYFFFPFVNPASSKSSREAFFTSFFFLTMGALVLLCCCSSFDSFSLLAATLASNLSLSSAFRSAGRPSYEGNFSVSIVAIIASKLRLRVRLLPVGFLQIVLPVWPASLLDLALSDLLWTCCSSPMAKVAALAVVNGTPSRTTNCEWR
jgi:hypothetical protein